MASTPTPQSYQSLLGQAMATFIAKSGISGMRIGGPILTALETAVQGDFRVTQDLFTFLNSISVDSATGSTLIALGNSEDVPILGAVAASGLVNFIDSSFQKVSSVIYTGTAAPTAGSSSINILSIAGFSGSPNFGSVYIGRGTINLEGPIAYTAITPEPSSSNPAYYTLTLASSLRNFHNIGESVVLAQGDTRTLNSGTTVGTNNGLANTSVTFSTTANASIADGETIVQNVPVLCQLAGTVGNVPANTITSIISSAFPGATVTNPLPLTNGQDIQSESDYRQSIKLAQQTRTKATTLSIVEGILGVTSTTENKTVVSANLVPNIDDTSTLYIDDGSGYEESDLGIASQTIVYSASGGETDFELAGPPPIAKAFVTTIFTAPFNLANGLTLTVEVEGISSIHTFNEDDFNNIAAATAFEIVASINGNPNLLYSARVSNNGSNVTVFSKSENSDDIEIVSGSITDANPFLNFPTTLQSTLRLYKNDILLNKNGILAQITTNPQSQWSSSIGSTGVETLGITIDNTYELQFTFSAQDFVNANTGLSIISSTNSLSAWAAVFNKKIPGITAEVAGNTIVLTSNSGDSSNASLVIDSNSSLVGNNMFSSASLSATGKTSDYLLNRYTGEFTLNQALVTNDKLTAGSTNTQAFINLLPTGTNTITSILISSTSSYSVGQFWLCIDGNAQVISTQVNTSVNLTISQPYGTIYTESAGIYGTQTVRISATNKTFTNVLAGDWLILWDVAFTTVNTSYNLTGTYSISNIDPINSLYIEIEVPFLTLSSNIGASGVSITLSNNGLAVVRSSTAPQTINVATSGTAYTLDTLASYITANNTFNATAINYNNISLRIMTNTYTSEGDMLLVTANPPITTALALPTGIISKNQLSQLPILESQSTDYFPTFNWDFVGTVDTITANSEFNNSTTNLVLDNGFSKIKWLKDLSINPVSVSSISNTGGVATFNTVANNFQPGQFIIVEGTGSSTDKVYGPITVNSTTQFSVVANPITYASPTNVFAFTPTSTISPIYQTIGGASYAGVQNTGTTTTVTILPAGSAVHGLITGQFVVISGCTNPIFNGVWGPINVNSGLTGTGSAQLTFTQITSGTALSPIIGWSGELYPYNVNKSGINTNIVDSISNYIPINPLYSIFLKNNLNPPSLRDRFSIMAPYGLSATDNLIVALDSSENKLANINMYYNVGVNSGTFYGTTIQITNPNNISTNLVNFALMMNARVISNSWLTTFPTANSGFTNINTANYHNKGVLWRSAIKGLASNCLTVAYTNPVAASASTTLAINDINNNQNIGLQIQLPSSTARSNYNVQNNTLFDFVVDNLTNPGEITNLTLGSGTPSGTNWPITLTATSTTAGWPNLFVGQTIYLSDGTHKVNFLINAITSITASVASITLTVVSGYTNSFSTSSGAITLSTANYTILNNANISAPITFYTGLEVPTSNLKNIYQAYWSGTGNNITTGTGSKNITFNINVPASLAASVTTTTFGGQSITLAGYTVNGGNQGPDGTPATENPFYLVAAIGTGFTPQITVSSNSSPGDNGTYTITAATIASGSIQLTVSAASNFTGGTGIGVTNAVYAVPTMPYGNIYNLNHLNYLKALTLGGSNNGYLLTVTNELNTIPDANYPTGQKLILGTARYVFQYQDSTAPVTPTTASAHNYCAQLNNSLWPLLLSSPTTPPDFSDNGVTLLDIFNNSLCGTMPIGRWPNLVTGTFAIHSVNKHQISILLPVTTVNSIITNNIISGSYNNGTGLSVQSTSNLSIYPIVSATTVNNVLSTINSTYSSILTGTAVADDGDPTGSTAGTAVLTMATNEEYLFGITTTPAFQLTDGINYIQTYTYHSSPNYISVTLKNPIAIGLEFSASQSGLPANWSDNNYSAETFNLVPQTALNVSNFLNSLALTSISQNANINYSNNDSNVTITSKVLGSQGNIQINGGTANAINSIPVASNSYNTNTVAAGSYSPSIITINSSQVAGLAGNNFIKVQNSTLMQKNTNFESLESFPGPIYTSSIFGPVFIPSGSSWVTINSTNSNNNNYSMVPVATDFSNTEILIEKVGNYALYTFSTKQSTSANNLKNYLATAISNGNTVYEGCWLKINSTSLNSSNNGVFKILRTNATTLPSNITGISYPYTSFSLWVDNPNAVNENKTFGTGYNLSGSYISALDRHIDGWESATTNTLSFSVNTNVTPISVTITLGGHNPLFSYPFWSITPSIGDIIIIPTSSVISGVSHNNSQVSYIVTSANSTTITCSPIYTGLKLPGSFSFSSPISNVTVSGVAGDDIQCIAQAPYDYFDIWAYDSTLTGDTFQINDSTFGSGTIGQYLITQTILTSPQSYQSSGSFVINGILNVPSVTNFANINTAILVEGTHFYTIKQILGIGPSSLGSNFTDILVTTGDYLSNNTGVNGHHNSNITGKISTKAGSFITALNKLNFSTQQQIGIDSYSIATGLIFESNRTLYGDLTDPITYPGIAADNARINISGPYIKTINLSIGVRITNQNTNTDIIFQNVQSAVAAYINSLGVGQSISLSSVLSAAQSVDGIKSAILLSPVLALGEDLINIQQFEKPLILNLEQNITVTEI